MEDKKNIFIKFIDFIKKIFKNDEKKKLPDKTEETNKNTIEKEEIKDTLEKEEVKDIGPKEETNYSAKKDNFINSIKLNKEEEDPEILDLQAQYENGKIELSELSDEQVHSLNLLYKRQISNLEKELGDKKTELILAEYRIRSYSVNM